MKGTPGLEPGTYRFVQTDASSKAIGAALLQQHHADLLPYQFASKKVASPRNQTWGSLCDMGIAL